MKQKAKQKQNGITKPKVYSKSTKSQSKMVIVITKEKEKAYIYMHDFKKIKWNMDMKTYLNIILRIG